MRITRQIAIFLAPFVCLAACLPAHAASCADRQTVIERLADRFGERVQSMGLGANNGIVEVFASDETGTWTITITMPDGMTCLVASGQAFETISAPSGTPA